MKAAPPSATGGRWTVGGGVERFGFLFRERKLADLADVDVVLHEFFSIGEGALEVEYAGVRAIVHIERDGLTGLEHGGAQDVSFCITEIGYLEAFKDAWIRERICAGMQWGGAWNET